MLAGVTRMLIGDGLCSPVRSARTPSLRPGSRTRLEQVAHAPRPDPRMVRMASTPDDARPMSLQQAQAKRSAETVFRARQHLVEGSGVISGSPGCLHRETLDLDASSHQGIR